MKHLLIIVILAYGLSLNSQNSETENIKTTIIEFFEAFHNQDTLALKAMAKGNIKMQSISVNKEGETVLSGTDYYQFVKTIASIPPDTKFEEKLLDFTIKEDGNMANVWTPYEFWFQEKLSHCGVNSFQLLKEDNKWKIIYLVDTRRKEGCKI